MTELKPCPFCNGALKEEPFGWRHPGNTCWLSRQWIAAEIIGLWNTRAHPAPDAPSETEQEIERLAHKAYVDSTEDPIIHCNRFPAWSELSEAAREEWRRKVRP